VEDRESQGTWGGVDEADFTFLDAIMGSGVSKAVSELLIDCMASHASAWEALISESFLPEDLKASYLQLISERLSRL
jgi:serine/threonine-protein kinase HipA